MAEPDPDRSGWRIVAFAGGLAVMLVAGFAVGRATGSSPVPASGMNQGAAGHTDAGHAHGGAANGAGTGAVAQQVSGLSLAADGYTLVPQFEPGTPLRFRIIGPDRQPATRFAVVHDKQMHLVVVRRDLTGYRHLHPTMAADGTWSIDLPALRPGVWRAYADFAVIGADGTQRALTLGTDLTVAGGYRPIPLAPPSRESVAGTLTVTYEGTPQVGVTAPLLFRVSANGQPVRDLQPYLGSYGHLVVLRDGDLGYVHVHPEEQLLGGAVKVWLAAPSPGRYRMFFDFQVAGAVHTAEFTLIVS